MTSPLVNKNAGVKFRSRKNRNLWYVRFSVVMLLLHRVQRLQACFHAYMKYKNIILYNQYSLPFPVRPLIVQTPAVEWSAHTCIGTASGSNKWYWSDKVTPVHKRPYIQPQGKGPCFISDANTDLQEKSDPVQIKVFWEVTRTIWYKVPAFQRNLMSSNCNNNINNSRAAQLQISSSSRYETTRRHIPADCNSNKNRRHILKLPNILLSGCVCGRYRNIQSNYSFKKKLKLNALYQAYVLIPTHRLHRTTFYDHSAQPLRATGQRGQHSAQVLHVQRLKLYYVTQNTPRTRWTQEQPAQSR
jgi:hypothetical protein